MQYDWQKKATKIGNNQMSFINRYATLLAGDAQITMGNKAAGCRKIASVAIEKLSCAADEMTKHSLMNKTGKFSTPKIELSGVFNLIDRYSLVREQIEAGLAPVLQRFERNGLKVSVIGEDGIELDVGTGRGATVHLTFTPA